MPPLPPPEVLLLNPDGRVQRDWYDWFRTLAAALGGGNGGGGGSGEAKFWVRFNSAGTIAASFNVVQVNDNGVGSWTVVIDTDFASANWAVSVTGGRRTVIGTENLIYGVDSVGAGSVAVTCMDITGTARDPNNPDAIFVVGFGDQ